MRIIFVTTEGFDTPGANNHLNEQLIRYLLNQKSDLVVIQSNRGGGKKSIPEDLIGVDNLKVHSIKRSNVNKKNFLMRGVNELLYLKKASKLVKKYPNNYIVMFQTSGLGFYFISKLVNRNALILHIQDLFPDSLSSTGIKSSSLSYRYLHYLQKKNFIKTKHIICISEDVRDRLISDYNINKNKISVVYNWYDNDIIKSVPDSENSFMNKYNLKREYFTVQYAGNIGFVFDYVSFFDLASMFRGVVNVRFQLIGHGSMLEKAKQYYNQLGLNNVDFLPMQPYEIVSDVYSYADVEVIPLKKGVIFHSVPSKASLVMGCSTPVVYIIDKESTYGKFINSQIEQTVYDYNQIGDLKIFITNLIRNKTLYIQLVQSTIQLANSVFRKNISLDKIYTILNEQYGKEIAHVCAKKKKMFDNKILLVTGGTGSFGNMVVKKFITSNIKEIRVLSRDEKKQDDMRKKYNNSKLKFYLGDVRDYSSIKDAFVGVDYVFHAAALKQVPSCEFFPMEAVKTNIIGSDNVMSACINNKVKKAIFLSTDKAAYPINAMGMSKAMMEKNVIARSRNIDNNQTVFCLTRYGNVMASRGSVIPLFLSQISNNMPITITNPEMTRFMMTLDDAVELVIYAFQNGKQGDLFVQKSPAASIETLANALLELKKSNSSINIIGNRHGEKLYEVLVTEEEMLKAEDLGDFYRIPSDNRDLNYANYLSEGTLKLASISSYHSHNTKQLSINEMKDLLSRLDLFGDIE